jgi:protein TonB
MESDENFPWAELAEFQNLIAILPSILNPETPSNRVKEKIMMKMNKALFVEESTLVESQVFLKENIQLEEQPTKSESKSKIDWGTLSVLNSSTEEATNLETTEAHSTIFNDEPEQENISDISTDTSFEEVKAIPEKQSVTKSKEHFSALQGKRKYALIFAVVFVLGVIVFSYFNLIKTSDNNYLQPEVEKPVNVSIAKEEAVITDSVQEWVIPEGVKLEEEETTETKEQIIKETLPTPPPQLPAPIETASTQFTEYNSVENGVKQKDLTQSDETSELPPTAITEIENEPVYFVAVEEMPAPIGGLKSIQQKIVYPEIALRARVEGKVFVKAFVDETGTVTSAEIVKGIGAGCDEAAIDAVLQTKFSPGKQRGRPIKVQVTIPIIFKL